ncbi:MAG: hypothetical protein Q8J74_04535 [Candidatus Didemnitutus sp.]|nr:hypothetical protein [Candidatus Didemnitutus sp.]
MSTPLQTAHRLLTALEDLVSQEAVSLRSLELAEAVQIAERAAPLVDELCALAAIAEVGSLRPRVEELVVQRRQSAVLLDSHLARLQGELHRIDEARRRLSRVAPAYTGGAAPSESRLNTAA